MILEVKNYTKQIKGKTILDNVNLKLESGHVYGFFGRNGSGKTMLFRAISTLIYPTSGDVLIDGKSLIHDDFDLRNIGLLLEEPGFYPSLTGMENLSLLYEINHKKDPGYIIEVLKKVGLEEEKDKQYREYSLGMKQRLRIGQAFMEGQTFILLDEPGNGLDESGIEIVRKLILDLKDEGRLILLASHNKEDFSLLCDVIYKVDNGTVKEGSL